MFNNERKRLIYEESILLTWKVFNLEKMFYYDTVFSLKEVRFTINENTFLKEAL